MIKQRIVILHNIISPYKTLLFNALNRVLDDFKVLYISETENWREWDVNKCDLKFAYEVMFNVAADEVSATSLFKETWRRLSRIKPEVLIIDGYSYASSWAGLFWALINKRKIILWSSSTVDDHKRVFFKEAVKRFFIKRCDAYNVYGKKSKEYLKKLGAKEERIFVVGNNTDNAYYFYETNKWRMKRERLQKHYGVPIRNFLYIGRFSKEKNILFMIDAFNKATMNDKKWGLILVGNGPQRAEIENYIVKNNFKNIFLTGFKQKNDIPKFLAISDFLVLPSISEPWGLVVNEALAAGLPVLVSRKCGCYPDIVKEGENGFSFNPYNKDELVNLMQKIVNGLVDMKKMQENSLKIINEYTPERAAQIIKHTIEGIKK